MLKYRSEQEEIMDDLSISGEVIDQTLKELDFINKWLGGNQISISAFKKIVASKTVKSLADLGCGGGDILMDMAKIVPNGNQQVRFTGIDANPHIIEYARVNTQAYANIEYLNLNIFSEEFRELRFDIIHCCLFTHHFTESQLVQLFRQFHKQAAVGVIINDLHRHTLAYWSIHWLTSWFSRSYMVKNDAKLSVARGFKRKELKSILKQAGITEYRLTWKWAFRWKLIF